MRVRGSAVGGWLATVAILFVATPVLPASAIAPSEAELANHAAAEEDAQRLLEDLRVPPDATFSPTAPVGASPLLSETPTRELTKQIKLTSWWTVPGSPEEALDWLKANPPEGAASTGGGSAVTTTGERIEYVRFLWPSMPNVLRRRSLVATVGSGPSGTTILRVDVRVIWFVPRPASEHIPRSARFLEVVANHRRSGRTVTLLSGQPVRKIVALVNDLPISQPDGRLTPDGASIGCPRVRPFHWIRLTFRARPEGRVSAVARQLLPAGDCHPMSLSIRGRSQPPLEESHAVVKTLRPLLDRHPQ